MGDVVIGITADQKKALKEVEKMNKRLDAMDQKVSKVNQSMKKKTATIKEADYGLKSMVMQYVSITAAAQLFYKVWDRIVDKQKESIALNRTNEQVYRQLAQVTRGSTDQERQADYSYMKRQAETLQMATGRSVGETGDAVFALRSTDNLNDNALMDLAKVSIISKTNETQSQIINAAATIRSTYKDRKYSDKEIYGQLLAGSQGGKYSLNEVATGIATAGGAGVETVGASFEELSSILGGDQRSKSMEISSEGIRAFGTDIIKKYPKLAGGGYVETFKRVSAMLKKRGINPYQVLGDASVRGYQTIEGYVESGITPISGATLLDDKYNSLDARARNALEIEQLNAATEIEKAQNANTEKAKLQARFDYEEASGQVGTVEAMGRNFMLNTGQFVDVEKGAKAGDLSGGMTKTHEELIKIRKNLERPTLSNSLGQSQGEGWIY